MKKDESTKVSPQSMAYPAPASPSGAANSTKNARQAVSAKYLLTFILNCCAAVTGLAWESKAMRK